MQRVLHCQENLLGNHVELISQVMVWRIKEMLYFCFRRSSFLPGDHWSDGAGAEVLGEGGGGGLRPGNHRQGEDLYEDGGACDGDHYDEDCKEDYGQGEGDLDEYLLKYLWRCWDE